jgi:hypothetical protein
MTPDTADTARLRRSAAAIIIGAILTTCSGGSLLLGYLLSHLNWHRASQSAAQAKESDAEVAIVVLSLSFLTAGGAILVLFGTVTLPRRRRVGPTIERVVVKRSNHNPLDDAARQ